MENATKALEMAGGILLAMLIVASFMLMFNKLSYNQAMQEKDVEFTKLKEFNLKYEAYNKKILYGADVISVINMALSNNATETVEGQKSGIMYDKNDNYNINIKFKLCEDKDITPTLYQYDNRKAEDVKNVSDGAVIDKFNGKEYTMKAKPSANQGNKYTTGDYYDLSVYADKTKYQDPYYNKILCIMPSDGITLKENANKLIVLKTEYEEFIERIFACTSVEYSEITGKVVCMTFEELKVED